MGAYSDVIDLGEWFGLKQQPYASGFVAYSITDPLVLNSGSVGFNAADALKRFPNYMQMLINLGWSEAERLALTFFTCAYNEAQLKRQGGIGGFGFQGREVIYIPQGMWYFNSELRSAQARVIGKSQAINAGAGGTVLNMRSTDWKSIYGAQNNGVRIGFVPWTYLGENNSAPHPVGLYGGNEWSHWFTTENLRVQGTRANGGFFNPAGPVEIGAMWWNPGEGSGPNKCAFSALDIGFMASNNIAPFTALDCELFYNMVAGCAQRGGAYSKSRFIGLSGDNNPFMFLNFNQGANILGTGPFLPHPQGGNPGGVFEFIGTKVEAFACRSGYGTFNSCTPGSLAGKGGMWARLSGRFYATFMNCTLNVHNGRIHSAIEVIDTSTMNAAEPGGGWTGSIPMDNSAVEVINCQMYGVRNYMHDWRRQIRYPVPDTEYDAKYRTSWSWNNQFATGGLIARDGEQNVRVTGVNTTWRGNQPIINGNQPALAWGDGAPTFNYNPITGANY